MTYPFNPPVQVPSASRGNLALDISEAGANIAKGLQAERIRRREDAMAEAMLNLRRMQAQAALNQSQRRRTRGVSLMTPEGPRLGLQDLDTNETELARDDMGNTVPVPEGQYFQVTEDEGGNLRIVGTPRNVRAGGPAPAQEVPLPPGQQPRDISPAVVPVETPQGPGYARVPRRQGEATTITGAGGEAITPRAQQFEVEKAQFAANMARAADGMSQVVDAKPEAVDEAIMRMNIQGVLASLPVVGSPAGEISQRAIAIGISPEAAQWLANFYTFVGFAVPEMAGKQMTITEMRQQVAMFAPLSYEPEVARRIKRENIQFRVDAAQRAAGPGAIRVGAPNPTAPPPQTRSPYGYNRR